MDLQHQDGFIFNITMDQWENSLTMEMRQWLTANRSFVKCCLQIGLQQKSIHSSNILDFIPIQTSINSRISK
eukprot:15333609-Ditylum_brightwellii.AAC.1